MLHNKLVYIIDDDRGTRRGLQVALQKYYEVHAFHEPLAAFNSIKENSPDLLVLDVRLGDVSGIDLFKKLLSEGIDIPVIFMSGSATTSEAVNAVQMGAFDFMEKPFSPEKLLITIERCLELRRAREEIYTLRSKTESGNFLGHSLAFKSLLTNIYKVAATNSSVLITGESGTGKELIAKEIHTKSKFSTGPFIKVNCSAIPESLIESELFGYNKGAFTGAEKSKKGYFELAHGGTLFLDEVGEMSLTAQSKVLRAIQNMEIQKLGSEQIIPIQVRIITATNRDLEDSIKKKEFREDLYFRINVFPIHSPSLRERISDVPLLAEYFLSEYVRINNISPKFISSKALEKLKSYDWPGNIRELKNVIERMAIMGGQTLDETHIPQSTEKTTQIKTSASLKEFRNNVERDYIIRILQNTNGNISEAANVLRVERTYLHKKIQILNIKKNEYFI